MTQEKQTFPRFTLDRRVEHILLILSFTILALTGLPQKYPFSPVSKFMIDAMGGIETVRIIHRVAATTFLLESIYHLVVIGYKLFVRREQASMLPGIKDLRDAIQVFLYNLGLGKGWPRMGRYNFIEKAEYWALVWGLVVMALTGFMLWNPIATTNLLPGVIIPAAKAAHGGEALLAVLAIILWHFYHVHIRRWNMSMFNGHMSREEMAEEHALELEDIEAGKLPPPPTETERRRRLAIFTPVAAVVSVLLLLGVYRFVTFEDTAIDTIVPIEQSNVFVPQTPTPLPTFPPTATVEVLPTQLPAEQTAAAGQPAGPVLTWNTGIGDLMVDKCGACHGTLGGLTLKTYDAAIAGGAHGPVIVPGDVPNSLLVTIQQLGKHPGQLDPQELEQVIAWIQAGAPEE
ncbi:MAG: hypothetical protein GYA17_06345 [Chloroflexi bacterium]|nr:hypothetical protein [Chloroflexota bacterium]